MTHITLPRMLAALLGALALPSGAIAATGGAGAPPSASGVPSAAGPALATWYGPGLFGRRTACGQTLTPQVQGVANRKLPCGTLVRVSYGTHSLVLPVLDRGPYGRIGARWDLTAGAAQALGITETVRVTTHVVGSTANTPTLGLPSGALAAESAGALAGGAAAQ